MQGLILYRSKGHLGERTKQTENFVSDSKLIVLSLHHCQCFDRRINFVSASHETKMETISLYTERISAIPAKGIFLFASPFIHLFCYFVIYLFIYLLCICLLTPYKTVSPYKSYI